MQTACAGTWSERWSSRPKAVGRPLGARHSRSSPCRALKLGAELDDEGLLDLAERSAKEVEQLAGALPGHPPWGAQADAARARVAFAHGRPEEAQGFARSAMTALQSAMHEDLYPEVVAPVAAVFRATDAPEWPEVRQFVQLSLAMIAQRTVDEDVRVRWFRGPIGRELTAAAGTLETRTAAEAGATASALGGEDAELLRSLIQGRTNGEISQELGIDETSVRRRLGELFSRIGASSRAEATAFAFRERVL